MAGESRFAATDLGPKHGLFLPLLQQLHIKEKAGVRIGQFIFHIRFQPDGLARREISAVQMNIYLFGKRLRKSRAAKQQARQEAH